jgi:hypothetical protein
MMVKKPAWLVVSLLSVALFACGRTAGTRTGETADPALRTLSPLALPTPLAPDASTQVLPTVAIVSRGDLVLAAQLAPGRCNIVVRDGNESQISLGVEAPKPSEIAQLYPSELPNAARNAIGPSRSANTKIQDGYVVLTCGSHGAAIILPAGTASVSIQGAGRSKKSEKTDLVVVGPAGTVTKALG